MARTDRELEQYRNLLKPPAEFERGFGWTTIAGIFFCGLIMLPGSIYLGLMTGGTIGSAATWVTVILFSEMTRRAMKTMSKGSLVILLHVAGIMMATNALLPGGPAASLVYRAYYAASDVVRDMGLRDHLPTWWVPPPDSPAVTGRDLFHRDWIAPILILAMSSLYALVSKYTIGYFFFRLCSDVERLPFPLAPVSAQGTLALADSTKKPEELEKEAATLDEEGHRPLSKWRVFTLGAAIGLAFGFIQVGVPAVTGLFLDKPVFIIPQPYLDTTTVTEAILPATPTGITIEPGIIITGMVLPFWAIVGSFAAIVSTIVLNPLLHASDILVQWQPGMNTVNTTFVNGIDFWLSFGIGTSFAIAAISVFSTLRDIVRRTRESRRLAASRNGGESPSLWRTPNNGRGDWSVPGSLVLYAISAAGMVYVANRLVPGLLGFLLFFVCIYCPFISYVNARLIGLTGQSVSIPYVREGCIILSGYSKVDVWVAPIPYDNFGGMANSFRVSELTGVNFRSLVISDIVALPVLFILSFVFWGFIWKSGPVPSDAYPAARLNWELSAKNQALFMTSTFHPEDVRQADAQVEPEIRSPKPETSPQPVRSAAMRFADTEFARALHPKYIACGGAVTIALFALFSTLGLPVLFIYGMVRGFGSLPHTMVLEIVGALVGRYFLQKKFGKSNFLKAAPAILAGYYTGVGLIGMATIALNLIKNAVSSAPF